MTEVFVALLTLFMAATALAEPSEQTLACVTSSTEGQTLRDEGRLLQARTRFAECAHARCPAIVVESCARWLADLEQRIPTVIIRVQGKPSELSIDGRSIANEGEPIALEPGQHALQALEPTGRAVELVFALAERERDKLIELRLSGEPEPVPAAPIARSADLPVEVQTAADPERVRATFRVPAAAWVLAGVGVAGVSTFAGLRVKAASLLHDLQHSCAPTCRPQQSEHGKRIALAADVSLGLGIAAIAGAAVWTFGSSVAQRRQRESAFVLAPAHAGFHAAWSVRY
ncbi:MAG: uncharacterized protein JWN04_6702 [Myxococcaceae bacterium]|nr:uncharacterized protein [Myxococcaceae bacterium]